MTSAPIPQLSQEIVAARKQKAPVLEAMMKDCQNYQTGLEAVLSAMSQISDAPGMEKSRQDISRLTQELAGLRDRIAIRHQRFSSGLITISIAGLEKAGKTTFLKSLTGIEVLPAFDERCTAVCCEIHYAADRSDFDIEFYTEYEFVERVLGPVTETITAGLPEDKRFPIPISASEFASLKLPALSAVPGGTTAAKLLNDLSQLQQHFEECRQNLGRPPVYRRPLEELKDWVSYRPVLESGSQNQERGRHLAKVAAVKVCRIYTPFKGGSAHLRWIDTPGVDDPNRRARDLTLSAIASETDLLVVASRPGAAPSPTEGFHHFWDSVSAQPDEVSLLNRMLFALNQDRRVDPHGENIRTHRKYLTDAGVPAHIFVGPYEAVSETGAAALMNDVNAHLMKHLSVQDDAVVQNFTSRLKHLQAQMRLLHDALAKSHPSDAGQHDMEYDLFDKWFDWYRDGQDTGFWTDLIHGLHRSARLITENPRILESEKKLLAVFAEEAKQIKEKLPSAKDLGDYLIRHRGENPISEGMRTISTQFSRMINRLSKEIGEFGPILQDEVAEILGKAGLQPLMAGKTGEEKLRTLLEHFNDARSESPVAEVLKEILELPKNLKYVLRYELRGAVDFCDPTLWNEDEQAWKRLIDMILSNKGTADNLVKFETNRHPPVTGSREEDHRILKQIAANSMTAVQTVLQNERNLPRRIADDFMRDCRVRLCFGPESKQEWRSLLRRSRGVLLSGPIGKIREQSKRIRAFQQTLRNLETRLP